MTSRVDPSDRKALLQQAVAAVDDLRAKVARLERARSEPIAIVGMACRYPGGANDPDSLWRVLRDGTDAITAVPPDRWDVDRYYDPTPGAAGKTITRFGGFLSQVDQFEPEFFGISPREAATMDPQQRLLLETSWEALECAGQAPDGLTGTETGVFVGITTSDYAKVIGLGGPDQSDVYAATGNALNAAAGRLSFVLGLQGPCVAVDTACSSGLVAVHLASQSLRAGECRLALAGGVNVVLRPEGGILFSKWGMLAPDGRCKTFDAAADGFVRSEGCGMLALKRLSDAIEDNDLVLAVIRGSAINQDGRSSGLTVPNGPAQQAVIRRALANAGIDAADVQYVEAHGTGTPLGDPIEVEALGAEFARGRSPDDPLIIGSVKTNIGHTEAAAGIAGVMKVVLALGHDEIPAHLHFREPSPRIAWDRFSVAVASSARPWLRGEKPRRAGVSSFGFSGTNAHVVIEEAPTVTRAAPSFKRPRHLLTLSSRTDTGLRDVAARFVTHLAARSEQALADVCFTAAVGRAHLSHRVALAVETREELSAALRRVADGDARAGEHAVLQNVKPPKVAWLFTGQGSQYAGAAHALYQTHPTFRGVIDRCERLLEPYVDRPLTDVLFPPAGTSSPIDETRWTQPALFAIEYALATLWREWGVTPSVVLGHSVGEFAAAAVAGALSLEDAIKLVATRGRLMQALPAGGAMAAVFAPEDEVAEVVRAHRDVLAIAAVNGPCEIAISGESSAVQHALREFEIRGIKSRPLVVSHAFHSPLMEPMLREFEEVARSIAFRPPRIPLVSNLTGSIITDETPLDAAYWRRHIRQPVRFFDAVRSVHDRRITTFLEIGPAPILGGLVTQALPDAGVRVLASLRKGKNEWTCLLDAVAQLHLGGIPIDWRAFDAPYERRRVQVPGTSFQRRRIWVEQAASTPTAGSGVTIGRSSVRDEWFAQEQATADDPAVRDHVVFGALVYPAAGYVRLVSEAMAARTPNASIAIDGLAIHEALIVAGDSARPVQAMLSAAPDGGFEFRVLSADGSGFDAPWTLHASGRVRSVAGIPGNETLDQFRADCVEHDDPKAFYSWLATRGLEYGPSYRRVTAIARGTNQAVVRLAWPLGAGDGIMPAALLDGIFQATAAALGRSADGPSDEMWTPTAFGRIVLTPQRLVGGENWAVGRVRASDAHDPNTLLTDLWCFAETGELVARIEGMAARRTRRGALERSIRARGDDVLYEIEWRAAPAADTWEGHVVLIATGAHDAEPIARALAARGVRSRLVSAPALIERDDVHYDAIVDLRALEPLHCTDVVEETERRLVDMLALAKTVIERPSVVGAPRCIVVTRGAHAPAEASLPPDPVQTALWGFVRAARAESTAQAWQLVDVDARSSAEGVASILATELGGSERDLEVAHCNGARWVPRLRRAAGRRESRPGTAGVDDRGQELFRRDASYVITGAFGGLGLVTARRLAQCGAGHLVLVGRSSPGESARETLSDIERSGCTVDIISADVSRRDDLRRALDRAPVDRPIRGIIHAAGVLADSLLANIARAQIETVLAAKVRGAWYLHEWAIDQPLDFFVMFAAGAGLLGSAGQAVYASANTFLDGLAQHRRARGLPALSIDWGPWADVGMAAAVSQGTRNRWQALGVSSLHVSQGLNAMESALRSGQPQVAALAIDWRTLATRLADDSVPPILRALVETEASSRSATPVGANGPEVERGGLAALLRETPAVDRESVLRDHLMREVVEVLGLERDMVIPMDQGFMELGVDSLMATELSNRLQRRLGVFLSPTVAFEHPTLAALTAHLWTDVVVFAMEHGALSAIPVSTGSADASRAKTLPQATSVDDLSAGEVDALLRKLLAEGGR